MQPAASSTAAAGQRPRPNVCSWLFFCWAWPTLKLGHSLGGSLTSDELPDLDTSSRPETVTARLAELWAEELLRAQARGRSPSLFRAIWHFYGNVKWVIFVSSLTMTLLNIAIPLLSQVLIEVIETEGDLVIGLLAIAGILVCVLCSSVVQQHAWYSNSTKAVHAWIALTSLIYQKPARLTRGSLSAFTEGELINLMTVDCQAFLEVGQFIFFFAAMPWQAIFSIAILFWLLGWVFVVGVAVLAANVIIVERIGDAIKTAQNKKNKQADQRSIMLNESLQGVRTVKLYAWEQVVEKRVAAVRDLELWELRKIAVLRAVQQFLSFGVPTITTVPVFFLYSSVHGGLRASVIFTAVAIFEFLNMSLVVLPNLLNEVRRMLVSVQRIGRFLAIADTYTASGAVVGGAGRVVIGGTGNFTWGAKNPAAATGAPAAAAAEEEKKGAPSRSNAPASDEDEELPMVLQGIDFEAGDGKLVVVCGRVGSGKTSMAAAALGLLQKGEGTMLDVTGRMAYVPQNSFVMNDTVKNNILFGAPYEEDLYKRVVTACALDQDLAVLPSGDDTEIGERGITISGGQRQRIAIARAAYSRADVIVLDDPLSAMDPHVGQVVFEKCILGLLGEKTRLFCTNQLQFASAADAVYFLDKGRITESGAFAELAHKEGGGFAALYAHVSSGAGAGSSGSDEDAPDAKANDAEVASAAPSADAIAAPPTRGPSARNTADESSHSAPPPPGPGQGGGKSDGKLVQAEKRTQGRVGLSTFKPLARASRSSLLGASVLLFIVLMPLAQYSVNVLLGLWTDAAMTGDPEQVLWTQLYVGATVVFAVVVGLRGAACSIFFLRSSERLHQGMLRSVLLQPMRFFDTTPVGRILNRFGGDMMQLDVLLPRLFDIWAFIIFSNVTTLILSMVYAPPMAIINALLIGCFIYLYRFYSAVALELQRLILVSISPIVASFSSFLIGLESIRAFDRVGTFKAQFQARQLAFARTFTALVSIERFVMTMAVCVGVSVFLASLGLVLLFLSRAQIWVTPGSAGVTLAYASIISFRLPAMFLVSVTLERLMAAAQRVIEYASLPPEEGADGSPSSKVGHLPGAAVAPRGEPPVARETTDGLADAATSGPMVPLDWPARGTIVLRGVKLRYAEDTPYVLNGISLAVDHGERVGIVGRTGAGKSSVLLALFRMAPTEGLIEIGGMDVSSPDTVVPRRLLRARLGMIPQDSYLFSGTIRSNLDVEGKYSDDDLWRALNLAHLDAMVEGLEKGLDSEVKEKGDNFSAGQVQLLCLARVLLKHPTIVFMDEATASVDLKTDAMVQETIRSALTECTIVTIAHRLATIIDFDKIAVLDRGRIAEYGPPHELLGDRKGQFSSLVDATGAASAAELRERARVAYT